MSRKMLLIQYKLRITSSDSNRVINITVPRWPVLSITESSQILHVGFISLFLAIQKDTILNITWPLRITPSYTLHAFSKALERTGEFMQFSALLYHNTWRVSVSSGKISPPINLPLNSLVPGWHFLLRKKGCHFATLAAWKTEIMSSSPTSNQTTFVCTRSSSYPLYHQKCYHDDPPPSFCMRRPLINHSRNRASQYPQCAWQRL